MTNSPDDGDQFERRVRDLGDLRLSDEARRRHLAMLAILTRDSHSSSVRLHSRGRRGVLIVVTSALVAGGVGVGAAAALGAFRSSPPTDRRIAACYTTDSLSDPGNHEQVTVATGGMPSLRDAASSALDICRAGWLQGRYSSTASKISLNPRPTPWTYPVPPLVPCVLSTGQVGVFPGNEATCERLGLPVAEL